MGRRKVRRSLTASQVNLEIVGIVTLGLALLLGVSLIWPTHSGNIGSWISNGLHALFGAVVWLFPVLIAVIGAIIFIEIDVPRLIGTLGVASCSYFFILDAAFGSAGGVVGKGLRDGLEALVGSVGAVLTLLLVGVVVTVMITNISVKRVIGWGIVGFVRVREMLEEHFDRAPAPTKRKRAAAASEAPKNLREAFHLPKKIGTALATVAPKAKAPTVAAAAVGAATVTTAGVVAAAAPVAAEAEDEEYEEEELDEEELDDEEDVEYEEDEEYDEDEDGEEYEDEDEEDDDAEYEDDEEEEEDEEYDEGEEGEEYEDEGEGEEEDAEEYEDDEEEEEGAQPQRVAASAAVSGEYEPAGHPRPYRLPDLSLFDPPQAQKVDDSSRAGLLEDTLASFGVVAKVVHIERGPSITRYELKPERGVKISRISALADDIALALAATSVRIEAPIPGKSAVGIEVPNAQVAVVAISEILNCIPQRGTVPPLSMALGKDITGRAVFGDLGRMPHLLVAGATGSGKSVCLNCIIASLLVCATPDQVQMLMIDPKRVELTVYNGIPHLIKEVITDARLAAGALYEMTKEMDTRYERFAKAGVRKIEEYNAKFPDEKLPYVVIVIDELADLMLIAPAKVETTICRLAQLARATGIHLIVATQRPSVDVITGIIKANIPSRIAFAVSSQVDSRTILDMAGAERLLGRGDMLYLPIDAPKPVRSQGALITGSEVNRLVEFWAAQARPENLLDVEVTPIDEDDKQRSVDPLCYEAAKFIIETNYASTAQLQSRFSIGHPRAVRVMKQLEEFGVVGQHEGTKPRRINIGISELETIAGRLGAGEEKEQPGLFSAGT